MTAEPVDRGTGRAPDGHRPITPSRALREGVRSPEFRNFAASRSADLSKGMDERIFHLAFSLTRAAAAHLTLSESKVHRRLGLTWSSFLVLYFIWLFDEVEARHIARLAGVSRQTISSVLSTLEGNGLILRERKSSTDRRLVSVRLSAAGEEAIRAAFDQQHSVDAQWFTALDDEEQDTFLRLLDKISTHMNSAPIDEDPWG
jgi:DNA-binding MarR family transcriptional regulator